MLTQLLRFPVTDVYQENNFVLFINVHSPLSINFKEGKDR